MTRVPVTAITRTGFNGVETSDDGGKTWTHVPERLVRVFQDELGQWIAEGFGAYGNGDTVWDALIDLGTVLRAPHLRAGLEAFDNIEIAHDDEEENDG